MLFFASVFRYTMFPCLFISGCFSQYSSNSRSNSCVRPRANTGMRTFPRFRSVSNTSSTVDRPFHHYSSAAPRGPCDCRARWCRTCSRRSPRSGGTEGFPLQADVDLRREKNRPCICTSEGTTTATERRYDRSRRRTSPHPEHGPLGSTSP